ncbi:C39 family peptidase [Tundrisphaera lichenicola]|uniref:C39 family peptidase n=1 Tax=Tundrisphaera lichenicola TaxID=2029860 RepID=UPI003EBA69FD
MASNTGVFPMIFKSSKVRPSQLRRDRRTIRPGLDPLEHRRLLTTASFAGGILRIDGTDGPDKIWVRNYPASNQIGIDYVMIGDNGQEVSGIQAARISRIEINGKDGDDDIRLSGHNGSTVNAVTIPSIIFGGAGDDFIVGGERADQIASDADRDRPGFDPVGNDTVVGSGGDDSIWGGRGRDTLYGGDGNDYLSGQQDDDNLNGGAGDDTILGEAGNDVIAGNEGNDKLYGDGQLDTNSGNDKLYGGPGNDQLWGGPGDDLLKGDEGDDYLSGQLGNDALYAVSGSDIMLGEAGDDKFVFAEGAYTWGLVDGGAGVNTLDYSQRSTGVSVDLASGSASGVYGGLAGVRNVLGGSGADRLLGNSLPNALAGNGGDDFLDGREGVDRLDGGAGVDRLYLQAGEASTGGERVEIANVPVGTPQITGYTCGPNSAMRLLMAYGFRLSGVAENEQASSIYKLMRNFARTEGLLTNLGFGTSPAALRDALRNVRPSTQLEQGVSIDRVLQLLEQGRPVIALIRVPGSVWVGGSFPMLHYVTLRGFDRGTQQVLINDNGQERSQDIAGFRAQWEWSIGWGIPKMALDGFGVRGRTILS